MPVSVGTPASSRTSRAISSSSCPCACGYRCARTTVSGGSRPAPACFSRSRVPAPQLDAAAIQHSKSFNIRRNNCRKI